MLTKFSPLKCLKKILLCVSSRETGLREQLSTPKFGTLYNFTKVSSDYFKVMTR